MSKSLPYQDSLFNLKRNLKHLGSCLPQNHKNVAIKETNKGYSFKSGNKRINVVLGKGKKSNLNGNTLFVSENDIRRYDLIKDNVDKFLKGDIKPYYTDKQKLAYFEQQVRNWKGRNDKKYQLYKNKYNNLYKKMHEKKDVTEYSKDNNGKGKKGFTSFGSFVKKSENKNKNKQYSDEEKEKDFVRKYNSYSNKNGNTFNRDVKNKLDSSEYDYREKDSDMITVLTENAFKEISKLFNNADYRKSVYNEYYYDARSLGENHEQSVKYAKEQTKKELTIKKDFKKGLDKKKV